MSLADARTSYRPATKAVGTEIFDNGTRGWRDDATADHPQTAGDADGERAASEAGDEQRREHRRERASRHSGHGEQPGHPVGVQSGGLELDVHANRPTEHGAAVDARGSHYRERILDERVGVRPQPVAEQHRRPVGVVAPRRQPRAVGALHVVEPDRHARILPKSTRQEPSPRARYDTGPRFLRRLVTCSTADAAGHGVDSRRQNRSVSEDAGYDVAAVDPSADLAAATERLLALLPSWFGIPEANAEYVDSARRLPGVVARAADGVIGVLLVDRHFPGSAEVHLMAVDPVWHRRGVGTAMLAGVEAALHADGCRFLQVKTLGASRVDAGYANTRAFYLAAGFEPLEETLELWPGNPCLILIKALSAHP